MYVHTLYDLIRDKQTSHIALYCTGSFWLHAECDLSLIDPGMLVGELKKLVLKET